MESFYVQMTSVHRGFTMFDFIQTDIDYHKCSAAQEDKKKLNDVMLRLLPQAIRFLQKDMRRFGTHLGDFFKASKFEIPAFVEEIKWSSLY